MKVLKRFGDWKVVLDNSGLHGAVRNDTLPVNIHSDLCTNEYNIYAWATTLQKTFGIPALKVQSMMNAMNYCAIHFHNYDPVSLFTLDGKRRNENLEKRPMWELSDYESRRVRLDKMSGHK